MILCVDSQMNLDRKHHRRAISDGMLAALPVRCLIMLCGAALLDRFAFLLVVFGFLLLFLGGKLSLNMSIWRS